MVDEILGKRQADDIRLSAARSVLMSENGIGSACGGMRKGASGDLWAKVVNGIKGIGGALGTAGGVANAGAEAAMNIPKFLGWTALAGAGTGALGAYAYDVLKENVSNEDEEEKFNAKLEAMYNNRKKELESEKWMKRVIALRDDLRRGFRKMTTQEYKKKYDELIAALDERA